LWLSQYVDNHFSSLGVIIATYQYLHLGSSGGHSATLHDFKSFAFPRHFPFPFELQLRNRDWVPGSHVLVQGEKGPQLDHSGSVTNIGYTVEPFIWSGIMLLNYL
jgi:hypothetical protein